MKKPKKLTPRQQIKELKSENMSLRQEMGKRYTVSEYNNRIEKEEYNTRRACENEREALAELNFYKGMVVVYQRFAKHIKPEQEIMGRDIMRGSSAFYDLK